MAQQASSSSEGAVPRQRIKMQMVQHVLLIWLDNNIDDNSADRRNTIIQLRRAANAINTFTDGETCIEFLERMHNDKTILLISGSLEQHVVPRVHNMSQVDSIFICCGDKIYHEQWAKEWSKIKGVFTEIAPICEALKTAALQSEQDAIFISFMATGGDISNKNLDQLNPSFMYTTIMKEILLTIHFEQQHFMEFIQYCRDALANNERELKNVNKLERKYRDETPIWWYTFECFLYPMLNRALRLMDVDIIIKMGFFIGDLHRHIEKLHKEQFGGQNANKSFTVYRGQGMSKTEFEKLTNTKGGLISFNNFLSTSKTRDVSLLFAESNSSNPDLVGVLFVMTIDPSLSSTRFASIDSISHFLVEDEVLFAMHSVFRIGDIKPMGENHRLFRVELTLSSDNDPDLRVLTDRIREETFPDKEGWYRLGLVLLKMGQSEKAQQVYERLLEQAAEGNREGPIWHQFGWAKYSEGEYREAITLLEKALEIYKKTLPPTHPDLAALYNNIGAVYSRMGENVIALSFYEKALEINRKTFLSSHTTLANSYSNTDMVSQKMSECLKAFSYYEKVLEIRQQSLPPNHCALLSSYNNMGMMHLKMGESSKALSSYQKAFEIRQQSLPSNHPDLAESYSNIGTVYEDMGDYSKASLCNEHAVKIAQQSLPSNHSHLETYRGNLDRVKKKL